MTIYVLLILYTAPPQQLFVNTFSSKSKCEKRITEMQPKIAEYKCVKTTVNK